MSSLLLGLYDESGELRHIGIVQSFKRERRRELRAADRPTVSTPVDWDEVEAAASDSDRLRFGPQEVLERTPAGGDLFRPVLELRQRLPAQGFASGGAAGGLDPAR